MRHCSENPNFLSPTQGTYEALTVLQYKPQYVPSGTPPRLDLRTNRGRWSPRCPSGSRPLLNMWVGVSRKSALLTDIISPPHCATNGVQVGRTRPRVDHKGIV